MRIVTTLVNHRYLVLAGAMLSATVLGYASAGQAQDGRIILAQQGDTKKKEEPKKTPSKAPEVKKGPMKPAPEVKKAQPQPEIKKQQVQPKPQPEIKKQQVQPKVQPEIKQQVQPKVQPDSKKQQVQPKVQPDLKKQQVQPKVQPDLKKQQVQPKVQPDLKKQEVQPKVQPDLKKQQDVQPKLQPDTKKQQVQPKGPLQTDPGKPAVVQPKGDTGKPQFVKPATPFAQPKGGFAKGDVNQIKAKRKVEVVGGQKVIVEPGNRRIISVGNRVIIRHDESARMRRWGNARFEVRGQERFTILNRGPYQIVTVTDPNGRLVRRYRRYPNGREVIFIDNRPRFGRAAVGVGAAALFLGLAAPAITIPRNRYIVEADDAPPALLYETLSAPPLMAMERPYTLDEIRYNVELRDRVRSIDLNTINFSTGSWEITPDQYPRLQAIADAILKLLSENADAVVMVEGHSDAVGTPEDNLSLSDRRAEAVAEILTGQFQIPPENLVTQGYGEQHLRVQTDGPSRENRRVQIRNITQLLGEAQDQDPSQGGGQPPG